MKKNIENNTTENPPADISQPDESIKTPAVKQNRPVLLYSSIIVLIILCVVGAWFAFFRAKKTTPTDTTAINKSGKTKTDPTAKEFSSYKVAVEPEDVTGISGEVSLGFNNAEQVVKGDSNNSLLVLVSNNNLILATRNENGAITKTQTLASGDIVLPAITRANDIVAIGWSEKNSVKAIISKDGGHSFGSATQIGSGTGISLAAENNTAVAVWHDGKESKAPSKIMHSKFSGNTWGNAQRVDSSAKTPLWASVDYANNSIFVTWRDNRDGKAYDIWTRRSTDNGGSWQAEQKITQDISGDPDICTPDGKTIWLAHHGKTEITLLKSSDGGASYGNPQKVGNGFFAHLSCSDKAVGIAWESTTQDAKSKNKKVGWAIYNSSDKLVGSKEIEDGDTSASTIYLNSDKAEILWLKNSASPLVGTLRHTILSLQ